MASNFNDPSFQAPPSAVPADVPGVNGFAQAAPAAENPGVLRGLAGRVGGAAATGARALPGVALGAAKRLSPWVLGGMMVDGAIKGWQNNPYKGMSQIPFIGQTMNEGIDRDISAIAGIGKALGAGGLGNGLNAALTPPAPGDKRSALSRFWNGANYGEPAPASTPAAAKPAIKTAASDATAPQQYTPYYPKTETPDPVSGMTSRQFLTDNGVPLATQNATPLVSAARRVAMGPTPSAARPTTGQYQALGNMGGANTTHIFGRSTTPGGRMNDFVGAGVYDPGAAQSAAPATSTPASSAPAAPAQDQRAWAGTIPMDQSQMSYASQQNPGIQSTLDAIDMAMPSGQAKDITMAKAARLMGQQAMENAQAQRNNQAEIAMNNARIQQLDTNSLREAQSAANRDALTSRVEGQRQQMDVLKTLMQYQGAQAKQAMDQRNAVGAQLDKYGASIQAQIKAGDAKPEDFTRWMQTRQNIMANGGYGDMTPQQAQIYTYKLYNNTNPDNPVNAAANSSNWGSNQNTSGNNWTLERDANGNPVYDDPTFLKGISGALGSNIGSGVPNNTFWQAFRSWLPGTPRYGIARDPSTGERTAVDIDDMAKELGTDPAGLYNQKGGRF
jgi:hypothetical protein